MYDLNRRTIIEPEPYRHPNVQTMSKKEFMGHLKYAGYAYNSVTTDETQTIVYFHDKLNAEDDQPPATFDELVENLVNRKYDGDKSLLELYYDQKKQILESMKKLHNIMYNYNAEDDKRSVIKINNYTGRVASCVDNLYLHYVNDTVAEIMANIIQNKITTIQNAMLGNNIKIGTIYSSENIIKNNTVSNTVSNKTSETFNFVVESKFIFQDVNKEVDIIEADNKPKFSCIVQGLNKNGEKDEFDMAELDQKVDEIKEKLSEYKKKLILQNKKKLTLQKKIESSRMKWGQHLKDIKWYKEQGKESVTYTFGESDNTSREHRFLKRFEFFDLIDNKTYKLIEKKYVEPNFEEMDNFDFFAHLKEVGYITPGQFPSMINTNEYTDGTTLKDNGIKLTKKDDFGQTILEKYYEQKVNLVDNILKVFYMSRSAGGKNITIDDLSDIDTNFRTYATNIDFRFVHPSIKREYLQVIFARLSAIQGILFRKQFNISSEKKEIVKEELKKDVINTNTLMTLSGNDTIIASKLHHPEGRTTSEKISPEKKEIKKEDVKDVINTNTLMALSGNDTIIASKLHSKEDSNKGQKTEIDENNALFSKNLSDFLVNSDYSKQKIKSFADNWILNITSTSPSPTIDTHVETLDNYIEEFRRYPEILFAIACITSPEFQTTNKYGLIISPEELPDILIWAYEEAYSKSLDYLIGDKLIYVIKTIPTDDILSVFMNDVINKIKKQYPNKLSGLTDPKCIIEAFEDICTFDQDIELYIVDKLRELKLCNWKGLPESYTKLKDFLKTYQIEMDKIPFSLTDLE